MKKRYVKPEIEMTFLQEQQQLLTSSNSPVKIEVKPQQQEKPDPSWGGVKFDDWEVD